MDICGDGNISLDGSAENLDIRISGDGKISANKFKTQNTIVDICGDGDCEVCASKSLKVNISGDGKVLYSGDPQVEKNIFGDGTIKKR
ncbi:hypothetical protein FACS1894198_5600 [Clostridia bacterium]|nr:hypothetical protein FACS1894198_5600 [Clostridia bacterium]